MKDLGYGDEYQYPHSFEGTFLVQEYLPKEISGTTFIHRSNNRMEERVQETPGGDLERQVRKI